MSVAAVEGEYEYYEGGVRHKPTGIRVELAYQNVEGGWTLNTFLGNEGKYNQEQVIQLGGDILVRREQKAPV